MSDPRIERMANAGQRLALHWGHPPWSDAWAHQVAEAMFKEALTTEDWDPPVLHVTWVPADEGVNASCGQWPGWRWSGTAVDSEAAQRSLLGHRTRRTRVVHEGLFGLEVDMAGKGRS